MFAVWSFLTRRSRFGLVLIAAILFLGGFAMYDIPKESSPEVDVPIAVISTGLPGAAPEDVETLVTNTLEEPLKNQLDDLDTITSSSREGVSIITAEFTASADLESSLRDVRDIVDESSVDLPDEASDPQVLDVDFAAQPVITATLAADIPQELLYRLGAELQDELEDTPGVSSVVVSGIEDREVNVVLDHDALRQHGLTIADVTGALSQANVALPVGSIQVGETEFPVRLEGDIDSAEQIAGLPVLAVGGSPVYVRDVARVVDGREKPTTISRTSVGGQPSLSSISFEVYKSSGAKITNVSRTVRDKLDALQQPEELLAGTQVLVMYDNGELLQQDLTTLSRSGLQTVALVMLILLLAVGWREAIIAAVAIPLSFFMAFIGLYYTDNTLNFISLFALILSIGIIVDSTIVIVEGINRRLRELDADEGESLDERMRAKANAALDVVREFHVPLTAGTLTTVAVFAPLLLVSGIVGEFIQGIPYTIVFVLTASLIVALGFVPLFATRLLRRGERGAQGALAQRRSHYVRRIERWYRDYLTRFLASRDSQRIFTVTLSVLFVLALALPVVGAVPVTFFDSSDVDYLYVDIELPTGATLAATDIETRKAEEALYGISGVQSFVTTVGRSSQFSDPVMGSQQGTRFANLFITLDSERERTSVEILDDIRANVSDIHTSTIRAGQLDEGPPSLPPISVTLSGDDLDDLEGAALFVENALKDIPGTADIVSSMGDNSNEYVLTIDRAEVVAQGVSIAAIAQNLRAALHGDEVTQIRQLGDDVAIVARLAFDGDTQDPFASNETTIDTIGQIEVTNASGQAVPISNFVNARVASSRAAILHEDGERIATVSSRTTSSGNALEISQQLQDRLDAASLPDSVSVSIGGESEDIDQSFRDLFVSLIIGVIAMFAILVLQFNSFRYAVYVLLIVPFSLIGVFTGLMITGQAISFPSIMGFIALSGIVVNNAIILIDTINTKRSREEGSRPLNEIIVDASTSRLRPVMLTALTTVIGITPLLSTSALWIPLAWAIIFGLAFSTIVTLLLVPSIYARWPGVVHE